MRTRRQAKKKHRSHIGGKQAWTRFAVHTGVLDKMQKRTERMDRRVKRENKVTCKRGFVMKNISLTELAALIMDAMRELTNQECPYCQANVSTDRFMDTRQIEDWLIKRVDADIQKAVKAAAKKRR